MTWIKLKEKDRDVLINASHIVSIRKEGNKSRITLDGGNWVETNVTYERLILTLRYMRSDIEEIEAI